MAISSITPNLLPVLTEFDGIIVGSGTRYGRANLDAAAIAGVSADADRAEAAADLAQINGGVPFASRAEAIAATIAAPINIISVLHGGVVCDYISDAGGTALATAGGRTWSPLGPVMYGQHFGMVPDAVDSLEGWAVNRRVWATATAYAVNDILWVSGLGYRCVTAHTSAAAFATDLSAGRWVVGAFTGTNNTPMMAAMIAWHEVTGIPMRLTGGRFRLVNPSVTVDSAYFTLSGSKFDLEGDETAWLFIDEPLTTGTNLNVFKGSNAASPSVGYRDRELFRMKGVQVRGRWSHKPGGNSTDSRAHIQFVKGYARLEHLNNHFEDLPGFPSRTFDCDSVLSTGNVLRRIAGTGLRYKNCNSGYIGFNDIRHTDDDAIDVHAAGSTIRRNWTIHGNTLHDTETIIALGAAMFTITDNKQYYTHGNSMFFAPSTTSEGNNASLNVRASGNLIMNAVTRSSNGTTLDIADDTSAHIIVGGLAVSRIAGSYNGSTAVYDPVALNLYDNTDVGASDIVQSINVAVNDNQIIRTKPAVAAYSSWGVGFMFHADGWLDPAVAETQFIKHGVTVHSDVQNFSVSQNNIAGVRSGAGVYLRFLSTADARNWAFKGGIIAANTIFDCHEGVMGSNTYGAAATIYTDVLISGNKFDLDPYLKSPARTNLTSGRWDSAATNPEKYFGISMGNTLGAAVVGNTFANCYEPIYADSTRIRADYAGNIVICQPASGGHAYVAANAGVGVPGRAGAGFSHRIVDCTPTSATYGQVLNMCPTEAQTVPTSGWYVAGHVVKNVAPTTAASKTTTE